MCCDVTKTSATELARAMASGALLSREVIEAHIARIEAVNPALNALVVSRFDEARSEADAADAARRRGDELGLLHGVPITIKESFDVAGTPTTLGLSKRATHRAASDAPTVACLRRAGAIVLGKTNVPQLVMLNETDNPLYGRTNNPHHLERATGGSSGGCAALVAAFGTPLSMGSDIGGSIRFPSHACGVQGFKPTANRLTMLGHAPVFDGQEAIPAQPGPIARTVADLELALRVLAAPGQETFDASVATVRLGDMNDVKIESLRVAMFDDNKILRPSPAVRRAVHEAAYALRARGIAVEEWTPPDVSEAWDIYQGLLFADGMRWARGALSGSKVDWRVRRIVGSLRLPRTLFRVGAWELSLLKQKHLADSLRRLGRRTVGEYWRLLERRAVYRARFLQSLDARRFDAILCPPDALPALTHGSSLYLSDALSYSALYNLLGLPAGVVSTTRVREGEESDRAGSLDMVERAARRVEANSVGLPVGVQVAARYWREEIALALMSVIESKDEVKDKGEMVKG